MPYGAKTRLERAHMKPVGVDERAIEIEEQGGGQNLTSHRRADLPRREFGVAECTTAFAWESDHHCKSFRLSIRRAKSLIGVVFGCLLVT